MATEGILLNGETYLAWEAVKDPNDVIDYQIDWSDWLGSDTISTSAWTLPASSSLVEDTSTNTTAITTIWLSAGVVGNHEIQNRIVTVGGRTKDITRVLVMEET